MEDNNVCITQLGTEKFEWFDLECDDWDSVVEAFDDEDAKHEYIVSDAEGEFAPIIKELTAHMAFEVAADLYERGKDCNLAVYVIEVLGVQQYLQNRTAAYLQCRDAYCGEWADAEAYVFQMFEHLTTDLDPIIKYHIDWEGVVRVLDTDGYHFVDLPNGNVAVWSA